MRGRIILFVVLAVVLALGGVYIGWSTSSPKAAADAPATPPSSVGPAHATGSGPSRSPAGHVPKAPPPKGSPQQGNPPKGNPPKGNPPKGNPPAQEPHHTGPVRFGKLTTAGRPNEIGISDDRRALTTTFSDFEVTANPASAEPSATKSFAITLHLTDGAEGEKLGFHVSGWAATTAGTTARLTLQGGGRTIVKSFPSGTDEAYVGTLWLPATPGTTYQLSVVLEIHKDAGGADGYINAANIESGIS